MSGAVPLLPKFQFSNNGAPMVNGTVTVYLAGTVTPSNTWQDEALTILNTNPIVLDARGEAVIYLDPALSYKFLLKNSGGVTQWTQDNIRGGATAAEVAAALAAANTLRADLAASSGASLVGYMPAGAGAVATTVQGKLRESGISVKDYGALGNGTDDLAKIILARDAAAAAGVPLIFPPGLYGISNQAILAKNGLTDIYFELGASLKLIQASAVGGAVAVWDGVATTAPVRFYNLSVDCNNIPGDNAVSGVHPAGVTFYNLTVKNCKHDSIQPLFGGKAIQWEGPDLTRSAQVFGYVVENCTIGIDIGAADSPVKGFTHIGFFGVSMYNVDIPIHTNDTTGNLVPDSSDQAELFIDSIHCRNCGKLTYPTANATGGGIIVMERGVKVTVRNLQVINDQGAYGTTNYGGIGALVRGQGKGLILENVVYNGQSMTAVFDFNPAVFQSPFTGDVASYVLATNIRIFGNLDFIVKCLPGGGKLGAGVMRQIEIGGTVASLAGIVDANAAAYSNTYLEVIDRENNYVSTGLLNLQQINALGNQLQGGSAIVGISDLVLREGNWTPIDVSGAGLVFTGVSGYWQRIGKLVTCWCTLTFPVTADGTFALIGGLPFTIANIGVMRASGVVTYSNNTGVAYTYPLSNATTFPLNAPSGAGVTNATASGSQFSFMITYLPAV